VRLLRTSRGEARQSISPGHHAVVAGLRDLPAAGDELAVYASEARAHAVASARSARAADYRRAQMARARLAAAATQREAAELEHARWGGVGVGRGAGWDVGRGGMGRGGGGARSGCKSIAPPFGLLAVSLVTPPPPTLCASTLHPRRRRALQARIRELKASGKRRDTRELHAAVSEATKADDDALRAVARGEGPRTGPVAAPAAPAAATPSEREGGDAEAEGAVAALGPRAPVLTLVIKGDVQGSVEAVEQAINNLAQGHAHVQVRSLMGA
jgi:translation initiation factor IF-2